MAAGRIADWAARLRGFKFQRFVVYLIPALIYPVYAYLTSENKLLKFIDALTIMGIVFLIIGIVYSLILHGDFDIMEYVAKRSLRKGDIKPFAAFKDDKKEERKDSINYPFFTCVFLLLASAVLAAVFY